ncbi:hypothetical protein EDD15DRAFT_2195892 [Pisolithus albus]|nr:hypothetical protein EDD15DRAFT_2195892 [Pisolithus albus]
MQCFYARLYSTSEPEYVEESPIPNGSAVHEICVITVGDDEHGGMLTVTGVVGAFSTVAQTTFDSRHVMSYSTSETEYVEESPTPGGFAVHEIWLLAVGDDEQGGVLTMTGVAGTSASRARELSDKYSEMYSHCCGHNMVLMPGNLLHHVPEVVKQQWVTM